MVKSILLKCDEELFFKMKRDKLRREINAEIFLTWEEYIEILFGMRK